MCYDDFSDTSTTDKHLGDADEFPALVPKVNEAFSNREILVLTRVL